MLIDAGWKDTKRQVADYLKFPKEISEGTFGITILVCLFLARPIIA